MPQMPVKRDKEPEDTVDKNSSAGSVTDQFHASQSGKAKTKGNPYRQD